ncbi:MAG: serine hydrolase domain-containing protein [Pseudomonadota bacterium]
MGDIRALYEENYDDEAPGLAVVVVKDNEIVFSEGFGGANLEYGIPISESTVFHVASLSKQFTAFAILKLEQDGLLSVDDDVRTYLPEVPDFGHTITLRHLLTHSSGLREQWRLLEMAGWRLDDVITNDHVLTLVQDQKSLNFIPGTKFMYCNTGFTLLAEIVERVTDQSFAKFANEQIFEPLEMKSSLFFDDHETIVSNRAYSYQTIDGTIRKSRLNFATVGPTSLFTTVKDMSKWAINFNTMTIGDQELFEKMSRMGERPDGSPVSYAMGQFVDEYKGREMIYHSGSDAGYRAFFARIPEEGLSVAVFANASNVDTRSATFKVIDLYLEDGATTASSSEPETAKDFEYDPQTFVSVSTEQLKPYEARYWNPEENSFIQIEVRGNELIYTRPGGSETTLIPIGEGQFKLPGTPYDVSVNFKTDEERGEIMEVYVPGLMWLWLQKVKDFENTELDVANNAFLGTYISEELGASYELTFDGEGYALVHYRLGAIPLTRIDDDLFTSANRNFRQVTFVKDESMNVTAFSVRNDGINSLEFRRVLNQ